MRFELHCGEYVLIDDHFERSVERSLDAVGTYGVDIADVETFAARELANEVALGFGKRGAGGRTREDIAETVEENAFEGADGERNVEESIVDRGI